MHQYIFYIPNFYQWPIQRAVSISVYWNNNNNDNDIYFFFQAYVYIHIFCFDLLWGNINNKHNWANKLKTFIVDIFTAYKKSSCVHKKVNKINEPEEQLTTYIQPEREPLNPVLSPETNLNRQSVQ